MRFSFGFAMYAFASIFSVSVYSAEFPLTSVETKPEQYVVEDKYTQYMQQLRADVNDGNADSMLELVNELVVNPKLVKADLPAIKQLIDAAEAKLGPAKVEFTRGLYDGVVGKFNGTTKITVTHLDLGLQGQGKPEEQQAVSRPFDRAKTDIFANCAALLRATSEYVKSTGGTWSSEQEKTHKYLFNAAVVFSNADIAISTYGPMLNSQRAQIKAHPDQLKAYFPQTLKNCNDKFKENFTAIKKYYDVANDEFDTYVKTLTKQPVR